ncbi:MAG: ATP synthase F1 subunit delta [Longimicrobiales bacterium]
MRDETVARNYAETLFELARKHEGLDVYGNGIDLVVSLLDADARFRLFLETPRIADAEKKAVVRKAFGKELPVQLLRFILITIDKRRQRLFRDIAGQFHALVDEHMGREHVEVTVARPVDDSTRDLLVQRLSALLGKTAIPHMRVNPEIVGGMIVRTGDTIYDGSVRRHLDDMRRQLLRAELPVGRSA